MTKLTFGYVKIASVISIPQVGPTEWPMPETQTLVTELIFQQTQIEKEAN